MGKGREGKEGREREGKGEEKALSVFLENNVVMLGLTHLFHGLGRVR